MDWDKLRIFHTVATAKSFTRAGEVMNLSQSAISRQISALEEGLQVALFHRHARGLMLSEQGEILFRTVSDILTRLSAAENALLESKERPRGPLKITAPVAIGTTWLTPHMREFCDSYPEIIPSLLVDDRELDLTMREADVAIRLFPAKHPDLIQKKLTTLHNSLYASNDYLRTHGVPKKADELINHRLVTFGEDVRLPFAEVNWVLTAGARKDEERRPTLKINSLFGILKAVQSSIGIAGLPDYMAKNVPGVSRVLPELVGPSTDVYFIYSMELRNSKRIKVFKEFILRKLAEDGLVSLAANAA
ncbi:MAG: LysR family transcriptional regulator [Alphaproteobacteria bacterium]|nr:LysR family transcriptional regulator [Alphaproteobacteria bacterium]